MGRPPVPTATVALIATEFIKKGIKFGIYDSSDFSEFIVPGTKRSYKKRTFEEAAKEAWELVQAVEESRPAD